MHRATVKLSDRSRALDRRQAPHTGRGSDSLVLIEARSRTQAGVHVVKVDSTPNFTPIDAGVRVWGPKTENFTTILAYKRPTGLYPFGDFFPYFQGFWGSDSLVLIEAASFYPKVYGMWQSAFLYKT